MDAAEHLTEHVAMIVDNTRPLYDRRRKIVADHDGQPVHVLARALESWVRDVVGLEGTLASYHAVGGAAGTREGEGPTDLRSSLATEILSIAITHVDWNTLAADWREQDAEIARS